MGLRCFWVILVFLTVHIHAQDRVHVQVFATETGTVSGACVRLYSNQDDSSLHQALTDGYGKAVLSVDSFPVHLEVAAQGYTPYRVVLKSNRQSQVQVLLEKTFSQLEEVVITGVAAPVKLQDALATYQIIDRSAMQAQGAVTVNDALKNQLNVHIGRDNLLGSRISMQGMKGDKVKVLVDGMPLNGRENGEIDLGQINLNNVERIEIVQGPMSVVYGTDALGGVVNIITKKNSIPWQLHAGTYYETVGQYNFDVAGTYRIKDRHQLSLGGGRNFFQGWHPLDSLERAHLWRPKEQYIGNFAYEYTSRSAFRVHFASDFVREKLTIKDGNYVINPFIARAIDQVFYNTRSSNRLQLTGKAGKSGHWQSQNSYNLYYRIKNTYVKDLETLEQQLSTSEGTHDTTRFDDFNFRGSYSDIVRKLHYTVGYDIQLTRGRSDKMLDDVSGIQDYAVYFSTSVPVLKERLLLQPALRYSYNSVYRAPLVPSFNALYKAGDFLQFRFSYASGFRAPGLKELYLHFYDSSHEVEGNPGLKPEKGNHLQFSTSWTPYRKEGDYMKFLLTGFYNDVSDQISLVQPFPGKIYATYTNIDRMRNVMGTLQTEGQVHKFYFQLGYTLTRFLNMETVQDLSHQATAQIRYRFPKAGVNVSTFYKYFGRQARLVPTIDGGASFNGVIDPFSFWDASLEKKFWKNRVQLIAGVKNILNVQSSIVSGSVSSGVHSTGTAPGLETIAMGRSVFTSLRISLQ